jgi:DeoR/GlpR family transcriptional regulator of sugar metabolism
MLQAIKHYLASRGEASLRDVAAHVDVAPETARAMLEHWMRKGMIARCEEGCRGCAAECGKSLERYRWRAESAARHSPAPGLRPASE